MLAYFCHVMSWKMIFFLYCFAVDSDFIQGVKKFFGSREKKELVDPYFKFSFAGKQVISFWQ